MRRRPVVLAVRGPGAAPPAGGGGGVGAPAPAPAPGAPTRDRGASAVAANQHDERSAIGLASRSAVLSGQGLLAASVADLSKAITAAQATYDSSARVADDAARQHLADVIAEARAALAGSPAPERAHELVLRLSTASADVTSADPAATAGATP